MFGMVILCTCAVSREIYAMPVNFTCVVADDVMLTCRIL